MKHKRADLPFYCMKRKEIRMKSIYLFDLDGTLTDPKQGITKSVAYALSKFDIYVPHLDDLCVFIGPPLLDSFMEYYHMSKEEAEQAITYYREYFSVTGLFENEVYDGIKTVLQTLQKQGKKCYVATSKPETFAKQIIEHFGLQAYFEDICGATMDGTRSKKGDVIAYALQKHHIAKEDAVMVGDRKHDILGAKENGLPCIAVLYGYGNRKEFEEAGADIIIENVPSFIEYLKKEA